MNLQHLNLTGFFIPGGNNLPDLYVHPNDPADWVTMQIAARKPTDANATTAKDVATTATVGAASSAVPDWTKRIVDAIFAKFPNPKEYFKGAAVAGVLLLLAIGLILFGAYNLVKE